METEVLPDAPPSSGGSEPTRDSEGCADGATPPGSRCDTKAGTKGITYDRNDKKWRARINVMGKRIFLGKYDQEEHAACAYQQARVLVFGRDNCPDIGPGVLDVERLSASAKAQLHLLREQALAGGGGGEAAGPQRTSSRGSRPLLSEGSGHQLSEESQQQPPPPAQLPPAAKSPARPRPQQAGDREGTPSKRRRRAASTPSVSSGQAQQQVQAQGLGASEALLRNTERHLSIISEMFAMSDKQQLQREQLQREQQQQPQQQQQPPPQPPQPAPATLTPDIHSSKDAADAGSPLPPRKSSLLQAASRPLLLPTSAAAAAAAALGGPASRQQQAAGEGQGRLPQYDALLNGAPLTDSARPAVNVLLQHAHMLVQAAGPEAFSQWAAAAVSSAQQRIGLRSPPPGSSSSPGAPATLARARSGPLGPSTSGAAPPLGRAASLPLPVLLPGLPMLGLPLPATPTPLPASGSSQHQVKLESAVAAVQQLFSTQKPQHTTPAASACRPQPALPRGQAQASPLQAQHSLREWLRPQQQQKQPQPPPPHQEQQGLAMATSPLPAPRQAATKSAQGKQAELAALLIQRVLDSVVDAAAPASLATAADGAGGGLRPAQQQLPHMIPGALRAAGASSVDGVPVTLPVPLQPPLATPRMQQQQPPPPQQQQWPRQQQVDWALMNQLLPPLPPPQPNLRRQQSQTPPGQPLPPSSPQLLPQPPSQRQQQPPQGESPLLPYALACLDSQAGCEQQQWQPPGQHPDEALLLQRQPQPQQPAGQAEQASDCKPHPPGSANQAQLRLGMAEVSSSGDTTSAAAAATAAAGGEDLPLLALQPLDSYEAAMAQLPGLNAADDALHAEALAFLVNDIFYQGSELADAINPL